MSASTPVQPVILIKSAHDIGSAIAHGLKTRGERVVLWESPAPGATRRLMCFAGAVHDGRAELEGITAVRADGADDALHRALHPSPHPGAEADALPLLVAPLDDPAPFRAEVLVDARMRKKATPDVLLTQAAFTIGVGPGFVAGEHVHAVIESNWGDALGRVIRQGGSEAYTGLHRKVEGFGAERYIYAPHDGVFRTERALLEPLDAGDVAGQVDRTPLKVAAGGILRGLASNGLPVAAGAKLVEVDPTGDPANCRGIGPRPARIARGVMEAIDAFRAGE